MTPSQLRQHQQRQHAAAAAEQHGPTLETAPARRRCGHATATGPGDVVKIVLAKLGYTASGDCGCRAMQRRMNELGWWGCYKHREEITQWFVAKAREVGVPVQGESIMGLIVAAWRDQRAGRPSPNPT